VIRCTKSAALRDEMRRYWLLPEEKLFRFTGPDWLLILLNSVDTESKAKILLLLWQSWHLRNGIIHAHGTCSVTGSALFLISYAESLKIASQMPKPLVEGKGKEKLVVEDG
jgi:hypothetical protein